MPIRRLTTQKTTVPPTETNAFVFNVDRDLTPEKLARLEKLGKALNAKGAVFVRGGHENDYVAMRKFTENLPAAIILPPLDTISHIESSQARATMEGITRRLRDEISNLILERPTCPSFVIHSVEAARIYEILTNDTAPGQRDFFALKFNGSVFRPHLCG